MKRRAFLALPAVALVPRRPSLPAAETSVVAAGATGATMQTIVNLRGDLFTAKEVRRMLKKIAADTFVTGDE